MRYSVAFIRGCYAHTLPLELTPATALVLASDYDAREEGEAEAVRKLRATREEAKTDAEAVAIHCRELREAKAKLAEAQSFLSMVHTFGHRLPQTVQRELSEAIPRIFAADYREGGEK